MSISTSAMIHCVKAIWLAIQWLCRINILCDEVDCNTNPRNKENANWCFFISADFSKTNRQLLTNYNSLPKLEFGFRAKHFTIQQRHRLVDVISFLKTTMYVLRYFLMSLRNFIRRGILDYFINCANSLTKIFIFKSYICVVCSWNE